MSNCHLHLIQKAAISTAYKMLLKKRTRGRRPMNGNASTVEPPGKKASNEVKVGEASFKYIDCYKCKPQMQSVAHLLCTEEAQKYKLW